MELPRTRVLDECESSSGPKMALLQKIADHFEVSVDDLIDNRIDENWIKSPSLAPAFQAVEGSRLRTSLAVIHWIEKHYGRAPTHSLMRALRIPQNTLRDPDQPVRLRLLGTLLRAARARGLPESSIFEMGAGAIDIPENQWVREFLAKHEGSPRRLYEHFLTEYIERFESNYEYKIDSTTENSIVLRIRPREERIEENGFEVAADRSIAIYRWGVAAGLLKAIGQGPALTTPLHYVSSDSNDELVRFEWTRSPKNVAPLKTRPSLQLISTL